MPIDPSNPFPLPTANVPDFTGSAVNTLTAPNEGPRTIPINLSGITTRTYIITIPPWDGHRGLSQICSIGIDGGISSPQTTPSSLSLYFPDTQFSYDVPLGFSGVVPVVTNGLTFFVYAPSGVGAIRINVNNFFIPPAIGAINANLNSIVGSPLTTSSVSGGRQSVSIGAQTLSPIVVGYGGTTQPENIAQIGGSSANIANGRLPIDIQAKSGPANGMLGNVAIANPAAAATTTVPVYNTAGRILQSFDVALSNVTNGGAANFIVTNLFLDGILIWSAFFGLAAGQVVDDRILGNVSGLILTGTLLQMQTVTGGALVNGGFMIANIVYY